jgi:hypothetical protein
MVMPCLWPTSECIGFSGPTTYPFRTWKTRRYVVDARDLNKSNSRGHIFFHVEPHQNDIMLLKMRWL